MSVTKQQLLDFYVGCLNSDEGKAAKQYLASRKIDDETIKNFKLGYCPSDWGGHNIWKRRVIFPLIDPYGNVVAFSGRLLTYATKDTNGSNVLAEIGTNRVVRRTLPDGSKEDFAMMQFHDSFPKNYYLYGVEQAKSHIMKMGYVNVVEGQADVLSMHSAGLKNTVGTCGSAITPFHLITLCRYCDSVVFLFDADDGGRKALNLAQKRVMINYSFLGLPEGYDPNAFIMQYGAQSIADSIKDALEKKNIPFEDNLVEKEKLWVMTNI